MRNYTVIENDIVMPEIFETGKRFGFTEMKVAVAPIHPSMVALAEIDTLFSQPERYVATIKDRVHHYPIFFLYKGAPKATDSRVRDGLVGLLRAPNAKIVGDSRTPVRFEVEAENTSSKVWRASGSKLGCVNLGAFLHDMTSHESIVPAKQYRFSLSLHDVRPAGRVKATVDLGLLVPGDYVLDVDLVSEHVCWFERNCDSKLNINLHITV